MLYFLISILEDLDVDCALEDLRVVEGFFVGLGFGFPGAHCDEEKGVEARFFCFHYDVQSVGCSEEGFSIGTFRRVFVYPLVHFAHDLVFL